MRVHLAVVSMSARSADGRDAEYLAWHGLDHLPEQYGIDAIQLGQRWVSTPACRAARAASDARFDAVDHVVQYLFGEPVVPALDEFFALGAELRAAGRMPIALPPVELGAYELVDRSAHLVDADVLPWRPARGVYLLVEREPSPFDALLAVPGVAGAWRFRGGVFHERFADTSGLHLTVCYLDADVVASAHGIADVVAGTTPLLAAPFETVVPYEWTRALP